MVFVDIIKQQNIKTVQKLFSTIKNTMETARWEMPLGNGMDFPVALHAGKGYLKGLMLSSGFNVMTTQFFCAFKNFYVMHITASSRDF